jgi:micrococcal nuclease
VRPPVAVVVVALLVLSGCLSATGTGPGAPGGGATATLPEAGTGVPDDARTATVTRVVDGDTVVVELEDGTEEKVRLIGVDTPEVHVEVTPDEFGIPDTEAGRSCLRTYGERASDYAERSLDGRTVRLAPDPDLDRRGYYGRLLAYVYVDGRSFNFALVRTGHARVFRSDFTRRGEFEAAQQRARANRTGVWSCLDGDPAPAATTATGDGDDGGDGSRSLAVVEVVADAPGNDNENLDGEYVVFENRGEVTLDLSGWTVRDEAGHEYVVPEGTTVATGGRLTLYTGSGTDGDGELYWGRSGAVWNNGGDTVTVTDEEGRTVVRESY